MEHEAHKLVPSQPSQEKNVYPLQFACCVDVVWAGEAEGPVAIWACWGFQEDQLAEMDQTMGETNRQSGMGKEDPIR